MLTELETKRPGHAVTVPCCGVGDLRREVLVEQLPDERVMITIPPGEVAVFDRKEAEEFRQALAAIATHAEVEPTPTLTLCTSFTGTVRCWDAIGRGRAMTVANYPGGRVTVAAPPGGIAILQQLRVGPLRAALREAIGTAHIEAVTA